MAGAFTMSEIRGLIAKGHKQIEVAELMGVRPAVVSRAIYPTRQRARDAVRRAINRGEIIRPDKCQDCGLPGKIEAHHADYFKPLEVEFLCLRCHGLRRSTLALNGQNGKRVA